MKNLIMKMKKEEGFIGVEAMVIAGLVVAAGLIALTAVMGSMKDQAQLAHVELDGASADAFTV